MAYVLIVDNHGNEIARFHHSELVPQRDRFYKAIHDARESDEKCRPLNDDELDRLWKDISHP